MKADERFVVDSQVVHYHYQEDLGQAPPASASAVSFFVQLKTCGAALYLDSGDHILEEWSRHVSTEWFDSWFMDLAGAANVRTIEAPACTQLLKKLSIACGFPKSENAWLVRVAVSAATSIDPCSLLTEDMDFREPAQKRCSRATRDRYLSGSKKGAVADELWKHSVEVISLQLALA